MRLLGGFGARLEGPAFNPPSQKTKFLLSFLALPPGQAHSREKLASLEGERPYELMLADLNEGPVVKNGSVAIMLLTLQFIRPLYRERVVKAIYEGLNDDGCLIVVEKILSAHSLLNRLYIKYYYEMKRRNGYSEVEISQKREALENVLIPYRYEENCDLLKSVGFRHVDEFFRWYNFSAFIAVK